MILYFSSRNSIPFLVSLSHIRGKSSPCRSVSFLTWHFSEAIFLSASHRSSCLRSCYASLSAQCSQGIQCTGDRRQNGLETALIEVGTSFIDDFSLRVSSKQSCLLIHFSEKRSELTLSSAVHVTVVSVPSVPINAHQHTHARVLSLLPSGVCLSVSPLLPSLTYSWFLRFLMSESLSDALFRKLASTLPCGLTIYLYKGDKIIT